MNRAVNRIYILIALLSFQFGISQKKEISRKELQAKIVEARKALSDLDCNKSLKLSQEVLSEANLINDNVLLAKTYNVIASNFLEFSDAKQAISYYNKALYHANLAENDTLKDWIYNNLGSVYTYHDVDFNKGIDYYKKGLVYTEKTKDSIQIAYNALNISGAYFGKGKFKDGYPFLIKASQYISRQNEDEANLTINSQYGSYYSHLNQNDKAEAHFNKAISYGEHDKTNLLDSYLAEVYNDFSRHYHKNKNFELAYHYLDLYNNLENKIYNAERTENAKSYQDKIEIDEYKRQISFIENEKLQKSKSLQKTQVIVFLFVIICIILLGYIFTLFKNNKLKKRNNQALRLANIELQFAKEKAEEATSLKSQFVSTITHELRTPLYGVVGITDLIAEEHPELKDSQYIKSLKFSAKYLLSLVNDILQIYKISEKKIVLENTPFKLKDELVSIIDSLQFLASKNNNQINLEIDPKIPIYIIGDKVRLSQIFMNLISNSLKFTEKGQVNIKVDVTNRETDFCELFFEVSDNGIGISKDDHEKVFEKFVQIERREDDYQGTGLGLPIVKKLIQLFGGEICLESEENKGTKISFALKFEYQDIENPINSINVKSHKQGLKVLIVEDNEINQIVTKKTLDNFGFSTAVVNNGYDAIECLKSEKFDIILMDINMPKINGFETSKIIREIGIPTPILALTAFDKQEINGHAVSSGMNGVIVKPFESKILHDLIVDLTS